MFFNVVPQEALILLDLEFFNKMTAVISLMVSFILWSISLPIFWVVFSRSSLISSCFNQVPVKSSVEIYQEHWSQGRRCCKILIFVKTNLPPSILYKLDFLVCSSLKYYATIWPFISVFNRTSLVSLANALAFIWAKIQARRHMKLI